MGTNVPIKVLDIVLNCTQMIGYVKVIYFAVLLAGVNRTPSMYALNIVSIQHK